MCQIFIIVLPCTLLTDVELYVMLKLLLFLWCLATCLFSHAAYDGMI